LPNPLPHPPRKKHWSTSWTVLEGGVLTFFKDSKTSAAGGLEAHPSWSRDRTLCSLSDLLWERPV
jgi:hypothetical protein